MGKKIVVITGSPRANGNSAAMAAAFVKAAEEKGHEVARFDAAMMNVGGCRACCGCFKSGKACAFDDDFNKIAPEIEAADAVVFAMPVYWYTMPAQIKAVLDKFYSFFVAGREIGGKKCALISCCEAEDRRRALRLRAERRPHRLAERRRGPRPRGERGGRHRKDRRLRKGRGARGIVLNGENYGNSRPRGGSETRAARGVMQRS